LIVIAQERNIQVVLPIVEEETQVNIPAKFKRSLGELANAQSAMKVRLPKSLSQLA